MTRALEWVLGMLGAALCVAGTIVVWQYLHAFNSATPYARQELWPFPGGYLVEMIVLGIVGLASVAFNKAPHSRRWGGVTWSVAGAVLGFAVLGALSIGPLYLPTAVAFAGAALLADRRRGRSVVRDLGLVVLAAVVQAGVMVTAIFILRMTDPVSLPAF